MTANRDYAYFIAIGLLRQKKYEDCMRKCEQILRVEPENHQVKQLRVAAEKELRKEGLIGVGIAAGASLLAPWLLVIWPPLPLQNENKNKHQILLTQENKLHLTYL